MPTGSGKTAVLIISAFLLRAKRVLVVTPSRLVREQIATKFRNLTLLKNIGVISRDCPQATVGPAKPRFHKAAYAQCHYDNC